MSGLRLYDASELSADGYPPEWHETIKHAVRAEAGDRCVRCSHPYAKGAGEWSACDTLCKHNGPTRLRCWRKGEWEDNPDEYRVNWHHVYGRHAPDASVLEARWRILTVHHLDGNKANCRWWNLTALCQRCHLTIQGRVRMERVYPWPHSDWFKPYVAGYYALTYLGEELDREQTEARLDELLGLELRGMRRIPTEKQMGRLSTVARPSCEVMGAASDREWKALVQRGWLETGTLATSLRITPTGLRALADALEAYGRSA